MRGASPHVAHTGLAMRPDEEVRTAERESVMSERDEDGSFAAVEELEAVASWRRCEAEGRRGTVVRVDVAEVEEGASGASRATAPRAGVVCMVDVAPDQRDQGGDASEWSSGKEGRK